MVRAPEPEDVTFEHLDISDLSRYGRITLTYFASLILIGACFAAIYGLNYYNDGLSDTNKFKALLSAGISIIISVVNIGLKFVVRAFSKFE